MRTIPRPVAAVSVLSLFLLGATPHRDGAKVGPAPVVTGQVTFGEILPIPAAVAYDKAAGLYLLCGNYNNKTSGTNGVAILRLDGALAIKDRTSFLEDHEVLLECAALSKRYIAWTNGSLLLDVDHDLALKGRFDERNTGAEFGMPVENDSGQVVYVFANPKAGKVGVDAHNFGQGGSVANVGIKGLKSPVSTLSPPDKNGRATLFAASGTEPGMAFSLYRLDIGSAKLAQLAAQGKKKIELAEPLTIRNPPKGLEDKRVQTGRNFVFQASNGDRLVFLGHRWAEKIAGEIIGSVDTFFGRIRSDGSLAAPWKELIATHPMRRSLVLQNARGQLLMSEVEGQNPANGLDGAPDYRSPHLWPYQVIEEGGSIVREGFIDVDPAKIIPAQFPDLKEAAALPSAYSAFWVVGAGGNFELLVTYLFHSPELAVRLVRFTLK